MNSLSSICFCNNYFKLATVIFFFVSFSNSLSEKNTNSSLIILHENLQRIVDGQTNKSNFDIIHKAIKKTYDTEKMGKMIVGKKWKKQNKIIKDEFIKVFEEYIASNYIRKFSKMKKLEFKILNTEEIGDRYKLTKVNLFINMNDELSISYLMHLKKDEWKIFDVLIDGSISEVATKKSEFSDTINNYGLKKLTSVLKNKIKLTD